MFKLIKNDPIVTDTWKTLTLSKSETPLNVRLPVGPLLVPVSVWLARRAELIHREYEHGWPLGILLSSSDTIESIAQDIDDFTVIAIEFERHTARLAYATARQLRRHYDYRAELRAIVPEDDAAELQDAGFDTRIITGHSKTSSEAVQHDWFNLDVIRQARNQVQSATACLV